MKTVGSLWTNSMAGWSAMASSRKKTTVAEHARDKAARAPKISPNLPTKQNPETKVFCQTKAVQDANILKGMLISKCTVIGQ